MEALECAVFNYLKESGLVSDTFEIPLMLADQFSAFAQNAAPTLNSLKSSKTSSVNSDVISTLRAFVGGDENRLVHTALEHLLNQPHNPFNPLVLCGRSGVGKSLLARCLASHWIDARIKSAQNQKKNRKTDDIVVITGDDWARGYVQAVRDDNISAWRDHYRAAAIFVIDDLPQLLRQTNAQRELVLLLDDLLAADVPVITTTTVDPNACEGIDPTLASRLSGGLVLQLQPPGQHARQLIVDQLTHAFPRKLTPEAKQWFAEFFPGSVPALQQALMGCLARANRDSSEDVSRQELKRLHAEWAKQQSVSLKAITKSVSRYCQIPVKDMTGSSRRHSIVQARSIAMYLAKQLSGQSFRSIGQHFGGRDHTTVMHACQKMEASMNTDPTLRVAMDELTQILRGVN